MTGRKAAAAGFLALAALGAAVGASAQGAVRGPGAVGVSAAAAARATALFAPPPKPGKLTGFTRLAGMFMGRTDAGGFKRLRLRFKLDLY